jgi:hypothetical protein
LHTVAVAELLEQQMALRGQLTGIEGSCETARKAEEAAVRALKAAEQCFDRTERQASLLCSPTTDLQQCTPTGQSHLNMGTVALKCQ